MSTPSAGKSLSWEQALRALPSAAPVRGWPPTGPQSGPTRFWDPAELAGAPARGKAASSSS